MTRKMLSPGRVRAFQFVKKVFLDFFDKLTTKLQNLNFVFLFCNFGRCGGLLNVKGNPDGSLSLFPSLRNFDKFFNSLKGSHRTGESLLYY